MLSQNARNNHNDKGEFWIIIQAEHRIELFRKPPFSVMALT
jgi:hypothetical protein